MDYLTEYINSLPVEDRGEARMRLHPSDHETLIFDGEKPRLVDINTMMSMFIYLNGKYTGSTSVCNLLEAKDIAKSFEVRNSIYCGLGKSIDKWNELTIDKEHGCINVICAPVSSLFLFDVTRI